MFAILENGLAEPIEGERERISQLGGGGGGGGEEIPNVECPHLKGR